MTPEPCAKKAPGLLDECLVAVEDVVQKNFPCRLVLHDEMIIHERKSLSRGLFTIVKNIEFGERLKKMIGSSWGAQKDFADTANISPSALNNYLSGRIPDALLLKKIANTLRVPMEYLLTGETPHGDRAIAAGATFQERQNMVRCEAGRHELRITVE